MGEFTIALLLIFSTTIFIVIVWFINKQKPSKVFPAGSRGLPFIGETLSFFKPHPANSIGDFMEDRISRYGKIFSSNLLGREAIVSASVELNRFVQNKDGKLFRSAWFPTFRRIFGKESLSFAFGESHKRLRSTIFDFLSLKRLQTLFLEEADLLASGIVRSWQDGSIISGKEETIKYSMQIMAKTTLSLMADDFRVELLIRDYSYFISALVSLPIYFPGTKYWKALKARKNVINMVKKIMEERINLISKNCKDKKGEDEDILKAERREANFDLLDLLLMRRSEYSDEAIEDFIIGMFFAGHDTTSRVLAFILYHLADSPQVVKFLQEEHLRIAKSKAKLNYKLSWDDYRSMEFTSCVINEALRLGNVAPFIPKKAIEEVKYKDIVIPRDSLAVIHYSAIHLDPSIHDNPMQFNPWRWLGSTGERSKKGYMPFGGGARMCPGENFAKLEMAVFLHRIILNYEWEIAEQDHPMHLPYLEFPKGLPMRVHAAQIFK